MRAQVVRAAGVTDPPSGRFDVRPASEVYLQIGTLSVDHMTTVRSDSLDEVVAKGAGGEMPCPGVQLQPHGVDDFFVFEAALNDIMAAKAGEPDPWPSLTPSELRIAGLVATT